MQTTKPKILTWHIHGSYLYYLTQTNCEFFIPVKKEHPERYSGLPSGNFLWGGNVHEIAAEKVKEIDIDCILFQSKENYLKDQFDILSEKQLSLPKIYLEHDPPRQSPTDTKHIVSNPDVLLVHVTNFNKLFWDTANSPTVVIYHGVKIPTNVRYSGILNKGIVVVNNLTTRGRRLGHDIFEEMRKSIPIDIVGMDAESVGGIGEISHKNLPSFIAQYRFFFNPIRYTSLGLSVCEAMMVGLPIVSLSTTEMPEIIRNGKEGFVSNDLDELKIVMQKLLEDKEYATSLGKNAQDRARDKFGIERFKNDWEYVFHTIIEKYKRNSKRTDVIDPIERVTL